MSPKIVRISWHNSSFWSISIIFSSLIEVTKGIKFLIKLRATYSILVEFSISKSLIFIIGYSSNQLSNPFSNLHQFKTTFSNWTTKDKILLNCSSFSNVMCWITDFWLFYGITSNVSFPLKNKHWGSAPIWIILESISTDSGEATLRTVICPGSKFSNLMKSRSFFVKGLSNLRTKF